MTRTRRVFTPEDRLSLLQEAEREGFSETCRKHNLSPALLSRWRKKYLAKGAEGLKPAYHRVDPQVRALEEENERLKRIVARQAMELEVKTEMLKKLLSVQEKREVMRKFTGRYPIHDTARWIQLSRRSYYYKAHPGPRGKRASTHTLRQGTLVPNEAVLGFIRNYLLGEQYCAYGYDMITDELRRNGFLINKKKTYRLMDENHLLMGKVIRSKGKRKWVTYRRIKAVRPMEYLCLNIKYVFQ